MTADFNTEVRFTGSKEDITKAVEKIDAIPRNETAYYFDVPVGWLDVFSKYVEDNSKKEGDPYTNAIKLST